MVNGDQSMPQACQGDFEWDDVSWRHTEIVTKLYWEQAGEISLPQGTLDLRRMEGIWMAGRMMPRQHIPNREEFRAVARIETEPVTVVALPYPDPRIARLVYVLPTERGQGVALALYLMLAWQGITLVGDGEQYFGARRVWSRLSSMPGVSIDIVHLGTGAVIATDVELRQGDDDADFDPAIWSSDEQLWAIRPVLRVAR